MWGRDCVCTCWTALSQQHTFSRRSLNEACHVLQSATVLDTTNFCHHHPCTSNHELQTLATYQTLPLHLDVIVAAAFNRTYANNAIRLCAVRAAGTFARCIRAAASCVARGSLQTTIARAGTSFKSQPRQKNVKVRLWRPIQAPSCSSKALLQSSSRHQGCCWCCSCS